MGGVSIALAVFETQWMIMIFHSHRIHGSRFDLLIYHKNQPNVGKYTSPMDPMGIDYDKCRIYVFQVCFTSLTPIFRLETFDSF